MSDLGAPSVLDELRQLWRLASPAERLAFLRDALAALDAGDRLRLLSSIVAPGRGGE